MCTTSESDCNQQAIVYDNVLMSLDLTLNGLINRGTYTGPHLSEGTGDFEKKIISDTNFIFPFTWCDWFCFDF